MDLVHQIILENMDFAIKISSRYARQHYLNSDGMLSEGLFILCKIAKNLIDIPKEKHKSYIAQSIKHNALDFKAHDRLIPTSHITFIKISQKGKIHTYTDKFELFYVSDPTNQFLIDDLKLNDLEKDIVVHCLKGYDCIALTKIFHMSLRKIRKIRNEIGEKLLNLLNTERLNYDRIKRQSTA